MYAPPKGVLLSGRIPGLDLGVVIEGSRKEFCGEFEVLNENGVESMVNGSHVSGGKFVVAIGVEVDLLLGITMRCGCELFRDCLEGGDGEGELGVDFGHTFK